MPTANGWLFGVSLLLYAILAFGACIYGSYRYEPSGVQYMFLPGLLAPSCLLVAFGLAYIAWRAKASVMLLVLPFLGVAALALPAFGMLLSHANLERARWATIGLAVAHAALLLAHLYQHRRNRPSPSRPAA